MIERIYRVEFAYRNLDAPMNFLGVLSSQIKRVKRQFKSEESISKYADTHKSIFVKNETLTLLWYKIETYCIIKESEKTVNRKYNEIAKL